MLQLSTTQISLKVRTNSLNWMDYDLVFSPFKIGMFVKESIVCKGVDVILVKHKKNNSDTFSGIKMKISCTN